MKQGIIFDMDGVLVHTDRFHYLAWKQLANAKGIPFDETVNRRLRGLSREASLDIILEGCPGAAYSEAERRRCARRKTKSAAATSPP